MNEESVDCRDAKNKQTNKQILISEHSTLTYLDLGVIAMLIRRGAVLGEVRQGTCRTVTLSTA